MTIKGIIFDFDGLIIDTETPELQAWHELYQHYGVEFSFGDYSQTIGRVYNDASEVDMLQSRLDYPIDKEKIFSEFKKRKVALIDAQPLRSGVKELLLASKTAGLKIGLASSSKREWIDRYIKAHRIDQFFDCIKTIDNAHNPKPDPEIYLLALKCLGFAPSEVIALEDSFNGITAAKTAGCFTIAVPNSVTKGFDFSQADLIIQHLSDMSLQEMMATFEKK